MKRVKEAVVTDEHGVDHPVVLSWENEPEEELSEWVLQFYSPYKKRWVVSADCIHFGGTVTTMTINEILPWAKKHKDSVRQYRIRNLRTRAVMLAAVL